MCEISDLIFEANKDLYKKNLEQGCILYHNPIYNVEKFYEENKLVGIFVWIELDGIIYLEEAHYLGKNHQNGVNFWRKIFDKKKKYRAMILKVNYRMYKFYNKMKFKVIKEDAMNYYFEYNGGL